MSIKFKEEKTFKFNSVEEFKDVIDWILSWIEDLEINVDEEILTEEELKELENEESALFKDEEEFE